MIPFLDAFPEAGALMLATLEQKAKEFDALNKRTGGTGGIVLMVPHGMYTALHLGFAPHAVQVDDGRWVPIQCGVGDEVTFVMQTGFEFPEVGGGR